MSRFASSLRVITPVLMFALAAASSLAAQASTRSAPAFWFSFGGSMARADGDNLNGGTTGIAQGSIGYRLGSHFAVELEGSSADVLGARRHKPGTCRRITIVLHTGTYNGTLCSESAAMDHLVGGSVDLDYVGHSIGSRPLLVSLGIGDYHASGAPRQDANATFPDSVASNALGVRVGVEQVLFQGPNAALTVRIAPLLLPNIRHGYYWSLPIGVTLWGW